MSIIQDWASVSPTGVTRLLTSDEKVVLVNDLASFFAGGTSFFKVTDPTASSLTLLTGVDTILPLPATDNALFTIASNLITFKKAGVVSATLVFTSVRTVSADAQVNLCAVNSANVNIANSRRGFEASGTSKSVNFPLISSVSVGSAFKFKVNSAGDSQLEYLPAVGTFDAQPRLQLLISFFESTSLSFFSEGKNARK